MPSLAIFQLYPGVNNIKKNISGITVQPDNKFPQNIFAFKIIVRLQRLQVFKKKEEIV